MRTTSRASPKSASSASPRFDGFKAEEYIAAARCGTGAKWPTTWRNLTRYAVAYFENLLKKYGAGRERKTQLRTFDVVTAQKVAVANQKLYVNYGRTASWALG